MWSIHEEPRRAAKKPFCGRRRSWSSRTRITWVTVRLCPQASYLCHVMNRLLPMSAEPNRAGLSCLEGLIGTVAAAAGHGGLRFPWAILNGAATSFVSPNILRQRLAFCERGACSQYKKPPLSPLTAGALWFALASLRCRG